MTEVILYDTTLRDGSQGEGISFSVEDKLKILKRLDKLGIPYVEGGWPGSNPKDMEFFRRVQDFPLKQAKVTAFTSTRRPGVKVAEDDILRAVICCGVTAVTVVGKTWDFHVTDALNTSLAENLAMISDTVSFLKDKGMEVIFDAEHFFDGYKHNRDYALQALKVAENAGADWLVLCDTNGGTLPWEVCDTIEQVKVLIKTPLGIHAHNDSELAVANSLMAVRAGAGQIQGTVNGFGERCGNANLCSIIPNLQLKMGRTCLPADSLKYLTEVSRYISEIANVRHQDNQPFVGHSAFAHKGGIHVSALLKNPRTYEHIEPELVGNSRRVLVSELSGLSNIFYKVKELNLDVDQTSTQTREIIEQIKEMEHHGFQFEGAEASLELLLRKAFGRLEEFFILESLKILIEKRPHQEIISEAMIKIRVNDQIVHTAADGNGPVNALDNALRKALEGFYPVIKEMHLQDYKVRVLDGKDGTSAKVRVLVESRDAESSWNTVGVSDNIIEASWQALIDSMSYALLKEQSKRDLAKDDDDKTSAAI